MFWIAIGAVLVLPMVFLLALCRAASMPMPTPAQRFDDTSPERRVDVKQNGNNSRRSDKVRTLLLLVQKPEDQSSDFLERIHDTLTTKN